MSTMITHTAMISVSTIIRTRAGIHFRSIATDTLDMAVAQIRPRHMTTVFVTTLVTASVEQMPRICTNTGLFFQRLSKNAACALLRSRAGAAGFAGAGRATVSLIAQPPPAGCRPAPRRRSGWPSRRSRLWWPP